MAERDSEIPPEREKRSEQPTRNVIRVKVPGSDAERSAPRAHPVDQWTPAPSVNARPTPQTGRTMAGFPVAEQTVGSRDKPRIKVLGVQVVDAHVSSRAIPGTTPVGNEITVSTAGALQTTSPVEQHLDTALVGTELAVSAPPVGGPLDRAETSWRSVEVVHHRGEEPPDPRIPLLATPESSAAEDYRVLRQKLRMSAPEASIIAVASPLEPGLSTEVAINLALALGEDATEPTLVVDANFGDPALADTLGISPPECFASQMRSMKPLEPSEATWTVMSLGFEHVHFLAIDPKSETAFRRFDPPVFRSALNALRTNTEYKLIIVDLPPPLRSAGFNLAGDLVDGVLLAGLSRTTRGKHLRLAAERLAPVPVLGSVLLK